MDLIHSILKILQLYAYFQEHLDSIFSLYIMATDYYKKQKFYIDLFFTSQLYYDLKKIIHTYQ